MVFGTMWLGRTQKIDGQFIITKFLVIGLPIAPMSSFFVTKDKGSEKEGFEMNTHKTSVALGYLRFLSMLVAIFVVLAALVNWQIGFYWYSNLIWPLAAAAAIGACVWMLFYTGKAKPDDILKRSLIGQTLGVNAYPEWLPHHTARRYNDQMLEKYGHIRSRYGDTEWQHVIRNGKPIQQNDFALLYTLTQYNAWFLPGPDAEMLLKKIWLLCPPSMQKPTEFALSTS
jgi:hypothetical protein